MENPDFHPEFFGGNEHAARLVADLCFVAHVWDDLIDKDKVVADTAISDAFTAALLSIPNNPFYVAHRQNLAPLIHTGILGYLAANRMEKSGDAHQVEIAHGLRYAVGQVTTYTVAVTNPGVRAETILPEAWKFVMPERFDDYFKEHCDATT
jgi:hypothetical protein